MEKYGGNPNCIVCDADIFTVPNTEDLDFILIGSDGIFDRISTEDTCSIALEEVRSYTEQMKASPKMDKKGSFEHVANSCGMAVDKVMHVAMEKESMDNLSVVVVSFQSLSRYIESIEPQQGKVVSLQQS